MIRLLDELTVGAIAAGEVVERPLSVVKELVENALDAGATRIAVAITRGGLDAIEVADDGCGIAPDDLCLAFARHATSKLGNAADLERIATLGFRGEGLASIAAVARVRLVSRTAASEIGYAVSAHGLEVGAPQGLAAPPGTRAIVEGLFANVPVRREYIRSPTAEFARISTFLAMLALGYPSVAFTLTHDRRPAFTLPAGNTLDQRLAHVFGGALAKGLVALDQCDATRAAIGAARADAARISRDASWIAGDGNAVARVRGFVSRPGAERGDRRMQLLFINGRLLRSTLLAGAWSAGYATYAMSGRHPFGVLFLDVPPDHVDPNVHPTKSDVRLRRPDAVHDVVRRVLARTLAREATTRLRDALSFAPPLGGNGVTEEMPPLRFPWGMPAESPPSPWDPQSGDPARRTQSAASPAGTHGEASPRAGERTPPAHAEDDDGTVPPGELRILAQLDETFVLATDGRALVLVDQHAAHERVAFEAIAARARAGAAPHEPLLVPYTIELDAADAERFERARPLLAAAGLEAEPFGERTYRIVATPAGYGARAFDWRAYVADLADDVAGLDARERVWASLACHSVVRAGDHLEGAEMSALLARLVRCENPMHCPHGRPTLVRIEAAAIARMFKRA